MKRIKLFTAKYPDLFTYMPAKNIFPHDQLVSKVFLRWLPTWVTPNRLTGLRIVLTPAVVLIILFGHYITGVVLFLLVAFTDVLDGSLARTRDKITKFGILFDPLADKLLVGSMVLILVFRKFNFWLGFAVLGMEVAFVASALYSYKLKNVRMANLWGKIKMFLQVVAVCLILLALVLNISYLFTAAAWIFGLAIGFAVVSLFAHGI
ncbi:MAG: CDP-alcohol phosphatidyltransferase family protein [Candidatus Magasanikbacteria bacterium]|nr:CDP-alcohol phosphatidyltransferase family protein [Candidatus Magasanikbacteria bacterium]